MAPSNPSRGPVRLAPALAGALLLLSGCVASGPAPRTARPAPPPERIDPSGVLLGAEIRPVPSLLGSGSYDLPLEANSWVESELNFLVRDRRDVLGRWMERGDFYRDFVEMVFREYGIPTDLHHLAMIESGFIPTARSTAGAVGMWQFMPATSRDLQLRVDDVVDERMDPVRSTRAAARHLRSLYRIHGDWALAAAAYNAGSSRISRGLDRFGATNFWDLARRGDLAPETQHYVPRLYAMTIIGRDRQRFGFPERMTTRAFAFDSIHVDYSVPVEELAGMTGLRTDELAALNPHLHRGITPAGGYWIWVPAGTAIEAQRAYIAAIRRRDQGIASYTVRWGDSLSRIAQRAGVSSGRIRELNPNVDFDRLLAGSTLQLPAEAAERLALSGDVPERAEPLQQPTVAPVITSAPRERAAPVAAAAEEIGSYTVRWGDTLGRIARLTGLSGARIRELNPSIDFDRLQTGARLHLPVAAVAALTGSAEAAAVTTAAASPTASGGSRVALATVAPSESAPRTHVVERGETLSGIARDYGVSIVEIQRANELSGTVIRIGQRLRIPGAEARGPTVAKVEHVVESGETLWGIARRYGTSIEAIRDANRLDDRPIRPGQKLSVPAADR